MKTVIMTVVALMLSSGFYLEEAQAQRVTERKFDRSQLKARTLKKEKRSKSAANKRKENKKNNKDSKK